MTKQCSICKQVRPLTEFNRDSGRKRDPERRRADCKHCQSARAKRHRADNYGKVRGAEIERIERLKEDPVAWSRYKNRKGGEYKGSTAETRAANQAYRTRLRSRTEEERLAALHRIHKGASVKTCRACKEELPFSRFSMHRATPDGLQVDCNRCKNGKLRKVAEPYWEAHGIDPEICFWCGNPSEHVDHIKPRALGGTDEPRNLIPACASCNRRKHARPTAEWITHYAPARHDDPDMWLIDPDALDGATIVAPGRPIPADD